MYLSLLGKVFYGRLQGDRKKSKEPYIILFEGKIFMSSVGKLILLHFTDSQEVKKTCGDF
jgi:hypothetical protein